MAKVQCTDSNYPGWTCSDCATVAGGKWPPGHVGTSHVDTCPVCGEIKAVTEPRDFGYPRFTHVVETDDGTAKTIRDAKE